MTERRRRQGWLARPPIAVVLAIGFLLSAGLRWWLVRDLAGPAQFADEAGYLGNARFLAGEGPTWPMGRAPYYSFGYSLVLVPLFRLVEDPALLHQATLVVNALLLAGLLPLLYLLARRCFGFEPMPSLVGAATASLVPAAVGQTAIAWSENLALPLFGAVLVALWLATTDRPWWQRVWLGPATVWLYATHPRFSGVVLAVVATLVLATFGGRCPRWITVANAATVVVGVVGAELAGRVLQDARWVEVTRPETELASDRLWSVDGVAAVAAEAVGQAWYVVAGSCGLAVLGAIGLWTALRADRSAGTPLRLEAEPRGEDGARALSSPRTLLAAGTALSVVAVFATSSVFFAFDRTRSDQLVYGRYNDAFVPVLAAVGVAQLLSIRRRLALRHLALAGGSILVLGTVLLLGRGGDAFAGPYVRPNIPAVARLIGGSPEDLVVRASAVAIVGLAAVAVAASVRRPRLGVAVLSGWFVFAAGSVIGGIDDYGSGYFDRWHLPEEVAEVGLTGSHRIGFDLAGSPVALGAYPFWLDETRLVALDRREADDRSAAFTFAPLRSPPTAGARVVLLDTRLGQALWIRPGPELERLAAEGRLLPAGFPARLPPEARAATISVVAPTGPTIRLRPGAGSDVVVVVGHEGRASPWPDAASHTAEGVVRLGSRWVDGPEGGGLGAEGRAELPEWMVPGDDARTTLRLRAVSADGKPLAPGRYQVGIDLVQEGFTWFTAPGRERLQLTIVVTGDG